MAAAAAVPRLCLGTPEELHRKVNLFIFLEADGEDSGVEDVDYC